MAPAHLFAADPSVDLVAVAAASVLCSSCAFTSLGSNVGADCGV